MSNELPSPLSTPGVLETPTSNLATVRSRVGLKRLNVAFFIVGLAWVAANSMATSTLFAAKLAILAPQDKVFLLGLATALAGAVSSVALFGWGAISDVTRSRFGRRSPWIVFGAVTGAIGLVLISLATSVGGLFAAFLGYGLLFNALPAAVLAVFPDRIPRDKRGTASAAYGGAQVVGGAVSGIVASQFLTNPDPIFFVGAGLILAGGLLFVVIAPDYSSEDIARTPLSRESVLDAVRFPKNAPDFYWAFAGRFLLLLGLYMVQNFMLYILTDYIGLDEAETSRVIALAGVASLVTIVVGTVVAGPLSDRIGRRKLPIFVASMLFGLAVLFPLIWPTGTSMILFSAVSGLGLGAFLSVDAALMTEVLPAGDSRGKDLGILNAANTVPGIIAPLATAAIVGIGIGYAPVFIASLSVIVIGALSIFKITSVR